MTRARRAGACGPLLETLVKNAISALVIGIIGMGGAIGCIDNSPPPARVPVPTNDRGVAITRRDDGIKPIEANRPIDPAAPPFFDDPIVSQQPPEQPVFVDSYRKVGSPRIVVLVNRSLAPNPGQDSAGYLSPGDFDEVNAKNIDYTALETILTDWLSCGGQVTIISHTMARQRLGDNLFMELQQGRPQVQAEIIQQLGADILVQMQARPTKQTVQGLEVRLLGEALNIKGGESLARAVVDVPPPLTKLQINDYTRFVARKLMDGMLGTWGAPAPQAPVPSIPATRPQLP